MKQNLLNLKSWLLMMLMCVSMGAWATEYTWDIANKEYANQYQFPATLKLNDDITIAFDNSGNTSNASKYYTSGTAMRVYSKNKFTLSSNNGNITKIEFTFGSSDGSNTITASTGEFKSPTWTGNAASVTFTIGGSSGHRRFSAIKVTYGAAVEQFSYTLETVGSGTTTFKDANGNTVAPDQKVNSGTKISPTFTPADGYQYTSWEYYTSAGAWSNVNGSDFTITKDVKFRVTYTAVAPKAKYPVTIVAPENGTLTIKDGETVINSGDEVEEGKTLTVEVEPADGYCFKNWGYKDGDAAWVGNLTSTFTHVMPSAPCSFKATFEEIPTYTINWSVNGKVVKKDDVKEGTTLTAPEVSTINEKEFTGWVTTSTVDADATPSYVFPTTATDDATFYAVFATQTSSEDSEVTENLSSTDIKDLGLLAYDVKNTASDGDIGYVIHAYKDNANRPWMQLKKEANSYVKITAPAAIKKVVVTITSTSNSSGGILDITKHTVFSNSGYVALTENDCSYSSTSPSVVSTNSITDYKATLSPTGNYTSLFLKVSTGARIWGIDVTYGGATYTGYTTAPCGLATINLIATDGNAHYATFSNDDFAFVVPEDLTVSVVSVDGTKLVIKDYNTGDVVARQTGVLVKGTQGEHKAYLTEVAATTAPAENLLRASSVAMEDTGYKFYKLAYKKGSNSDPATLGFYWGAADGSKFDSKTGLAYLAVPKSMAEQIQGFRFIYDDEETTGIDAVELNTIKNHSVYNLNGQRISSVNGYKGIIIVNGKKMLNK